jgi:hypothetical protein
MPEISRFLGIVVMMYYREHAPPHFHVRYGGTEACVRIDPPMVIEGRLSPRVLGIVMEWTLLHRTELLADWQLARNDKPLLPVPPLE